MSRNWWFLAGPSLQGSSSTTGPDEVSRHTTAALEMVDMANNNMADSGKLWHTVTIATRTAR